MTEEQKKILQLKKSNSTVPIKSIDEELQKKSEDHYSEIVDQIYSLSEFNLRLQSADKRVLRNRFYKIFSPLLILQFIVIIALIVLNGCNVIWVDSTVLTVLVSAMFVETLGVMAVMVKYCFDSKQEVELIGILNGIVSNFQKFKKDKHQDEDKKDTKNE